MEDFVLQCARAFGACIMQRDDPMQDKPKLREPDIQYHLENLAEIKRFKSPTKAEFKKYISEKISEYESDIQKRIELKSRYEQMIAKVEAWKAPTTDHQGLKKFMLEQLNSSVSFDCSIDYLEDSLNYWKNISYAEYVKEMIDSNERSLKYHTECIEKEKQNVAKTNKWITDLYDSLKT